MRTRCLAGACRRRDVVPDETSRFRPGATRRRAGGWKYANMVVRYAASVATRTRWVGRRRGRRSRDRRAYPTTVPGWVPSIYHAGRARPPRRRRRALSSARHRAGNRSAATTTAVIAMPAVTRPRGQAGLELRERLVEVRPRDQLTGGLRARLARDLDHRHRVFTAACVSRAMPAGYHGAFVPDRTVPASDPDLSRTGGGPSGGRGDVAVITILGAAPRKHWPDRVNPRSVIRPRAGKHAVSNLPLTTSAPTATTGTPESVDHGRGDRYGKSSRSVATLGSGCLQASSRTYVSPTGA